MDNFVSAMTEEGVRIHPTRVFVGGLARGTSELELENFFSEFGVVVDVRIVCDKRTGLNRGYGFITYESEQERDSLLQKNMVEFKGRKLRLRQAVRRKGSGQFSPSEDSGIGMPYSNHEGYTQWVLVPDTGTYTAPMYSTLPNMYTSVPRYSYVVQPPVYPNNSGTTYYYCV